MKKFTILLVAAFSAICLNGFSQTTVDVGVDWTGTEEIASVSGATITGVATVLINVGTENEVSVSCAGATRYRYSASNSLYISAATKPYPYLEIITNDNDYVEYSLTQNSVNKKIASVKVNGTSAATGTTSSAAIFYSDNIPFDEESVIGGESCTLAAVADGNSGSSFTAPEGSKSYRIYRKKAFVIDGTTTSLGSSNNARIGYLSATLDTSTTVGVESENMDEKTITSIEYFDITGRKVSEKNQGLIVVKTNYTDGSSSVSKKINK